jgi:hypothetical protein
MPVNLQIGAPTTTTTKTITTNAEEVDGKAVEGLSILLKSLMRSNF